MRETIISILCVAVLFPAVLTGQINSTGRDTAVQTAYSAGDSIFIFSTKGKTVPSGNLTAKAPGGVLSDFTWSRYNPKSAAKWDPIAGTSTSGTISSTLTNLSSGGYKVTISASGTTYEYVAWVFINNINLDKESSGYVKFFSSTCDYLDLRAMVTDFIYYNPSTNAALTLPDKIRYTWKGTTLKGENIEIYPVDTFQNIRFRKERLPLDTAIFYMTATDRYKLNRRDSVWYPPILSKAEFDTLRVEYMVDKQYSIPLLVTFENKSKNAATYRWNYGDGTEEDTVKTPEPHRYVYSNRTYTVRLITESEETCIDSFKMEIKVAPAQVGVADKYEVPNVFTPGREGQGGDGINDYFYFKSLSIEHFTLSIYSRTGKKIYEYTGNSSDLATGAWKGWDGNINGSTASDGVYYYILEVKANEKPTSQSLVHKDGIYKGFFYLFRESN